MSRMIDRVAAAIARELDEATFYKAVGFQNAARAAIEAMDDPTGEMTKAGMDERNAKALFTRDDAYHVFRAMIRAALKDK